MRKNVTVGFSPAEFMRFQGAAAVARMPVARDSFVHRADPLSVGKRWLAILPPVSAWDRFRKLASGHDL